jgi:hypothetical protein
MADSWQMASPTCSSRAVTRDRGCDHRGLDGRHQLRPDQDDRLAVPLRPASEVQPAHPSRRDAWNLGPSPGEGSSSSLIGWPDSPAIESLFKEWFLTPDDAGRKEIARKLQLQTLHDVTWIPLAQVFLPTVVRSNVTGILPRGRVVRSLQLADTVLHE